MLYLTSISRHTGNCDTLRKLGVFFALEEREDCFWECCSWRAARATAETQTWQKWGLLKCRVFYSCVLAHYLDFMVGFSLYTENKVIIFSPFRVVHKCIAVGVVYG